METIELAFDMPMLVGECPLWHPEEQALYWIDIAGRAVHRLDPVTRRHRFWPVPEEPGCIAWCAGGGLIVALRTGVFRLDTTSGALQMLLPAPYDTSMLRFNDGRCDSRGRLWVGTMYEPRDQARGGLFCIERGALRDSGKNVTVSNGVAFGIDDKTLFHADTTAHVITAYDFDADTGVLGEGRLLKRFASDKSSSQYGGRPDGAAVDSEGAYWCAMFEGGRLLRMASDGAVLQEMALPVRCPTMMAFGGSDLRTLYITSARHNRSESELQRHPLSGCLLSLRVPVPGRAEHGYRP